MYAYFIGKVMEITPDSVILEVNNIGYNIKVSSRTAESLPGIGAEVKLYTYTSVREDAIQLMGFTSQADLYMFRQLITVSGIGPKGALAILSVMDADSLRFAIMTGDVKNISKAPGVGKRSAERVIIDLKGKVDTDAVSFLTSTDNSDTVNSSNSTAYNEVIREATEALTALGYGATESMKAVRAVDITDGMDVNDVLKLALKELF